MGLGAGAEPPRHRRALWGVSYPQAGATTTPLPLPHSDSKSQQDAEEAATANCSLPFAYARMYK